MLNNFRDGIIENVNINKITKKDILKMYEIERDNWSYFMWEYVKCIDCDNIDSKKDIYWDIINDFELKTVCMLEKEYWRKNVKCSCCWWNTEDIRWEELINMLELRIFWSKKSFVNYYKSKYNEIIWFSYWFIDSPENTYIKEYSFHFNEKLLWIFENKFWKKDLLTLSWVCLTSEWRNINIIYELIKQFHCRINDIYNNITWTWEAIVWTPAYKIYNKMWSCDLEVDESCLHIQDNKWLKVQIVFQNNVVADYKKVINKSLIEFLHYVKKKKLE